jgi:hypothetical protein
MGHILVFAVFFNGVARICYYLAGLILKLEALEYFNKNDQEQHLPTEGCVTMMC